MNAKIIYTKVDEAPALATHSLLPIVRAFAGKVGISLEQWDISLAGRILANFPDFLNEEQRIPDYLSDLGELAKKEEANIIKLPNISASIPQLQAAIGELREKGFMVPPYPETAETEREKEIQQRYGKVLGSAVNPVLREGNSDRRAAAAVKKHGLKHPHTLMKAWPDVSQTRVASMSQGDFYGTETSVTVGNDCSVQIRFVGESGEKTVLKEKVDLLAGEIIDGSVMHVNALRAFYKEEMALAKKDGVLFSLHLKATMMKVSDPVLFGHCVSVYYEELFEKYADELAAAGVQVNNGFSDLYEKIQTLPEEKRQKVKTLMAAVMAKRPDLAMVDSSQGITNLHLPNNVIVDASMPVVIRDGGKMWGADDVLHDVVAIIPDRSYAAIYQAVIEDCQKHGAFDPGTMGSVANVGLMAQKAEEYGSHDKTFIASGDGVIEVMADSGEILLRQDVETGDIFRMCQTKDAAVRDWVKLAVNRAEVSGEPAVFWLDGKRAHDVQLIEKVKKYVSEHNTAGLEIQMLDPVNAMLYTLARVRKGENTIAVTGNVLRDYLTDLFPILELGTSARMLSIVPLMNGGGLFETGAGGSAPKHVQQFLQENHLRWDSLGEFCALVASFEHLSEKRDDADIALLASTLDEAIGRILEHGKSPSRRVKELDNRGSHFYLAMYWARSLAAQDQNLALQKIFKPVAQALEEKETHIIAELKKVQGQKVDIGGYYYPDTKRTSESMRPSPVFNKILADLL